LLQLVETGLSLLQRLLALDLPQPVAFLDVGRVVDGAERGECRLGDGPGATHGVVRRVLSFLGRVGIDAVPVAVGDDLAHVAPAPLWVAWSVCRVSLLRSAGGRSLGE
jgi:hypothetical protein